MRCSELFHKYTWEEIKPTLTKFNPTLKRVPEEYQEAYQQFLVTPPSKTKMRILIEVQEDEKTGETWYYPYGKDGMLVKDAFQNSKAAYEQLKDRWEKEQEYALSYTNWTEVAGMEIDPYVLESFSEKEILVHVLLLIMEVWRNADESAEVMKELHAIKAAQGKPTIQKEIITKRGFLQIWSEQENGIQHGFFTTYWEDRNTMQQRGVVVDGHQEGIWTYWNKNGKIKNQILFWCDRVIEEKIESPWWDGAEDQT